MLFLNVKKVIVSLLLLCVALPSWAWRGGWRGGGWGWRGPRVGVYLGPGPYLYPPYDPYYYYDPYPYYGVPYSRTIVESPAQETPTEPDNSRYSLKFINSQIANQRALIKNDYADGDITAEQRDSQLQTLKQIEKESRDLASTNGGTISGDQQNELLEQLHGQPVRPPTQTAQETPEPSTPRHLVSSDSGSHRDLTVVNDLEIELHALLNQKLKEGSITQAQYEGEKQYLDKLQGQAKTEAASNGGSLSTEQEDSLVRQLYRAFYTINHNFTGG